MVSTQFEFSSDSCSADHPPSSLMSYLSNLNQQHLVSHWGSLTVDQRYQLLQELQNMNLEQVLMYFNLCTNNAELLDKIDGRLKPPPEDVCGGVSTYSSCEMEILGREGLELVAQGRVGALLLAGGQGTRLGVYYPKGMYDCNLPSGKTLYQLQAERLLRLQQLAGQGSTVRWYIMTSETTQEATEEFFRKHNYFGLQPRQIIFFEQFTLPAVSNEGKILLDTPVRLTKAPDGNGGVYRALSQRGLIDDMRKNGIQWIHAYCVDNILVRPADPHFVAFAARKNADCASKVVEKREPNEAVGVLGVVDDRFQVVEYSEISSATAELRDSDGKLTYRAGSIANHIFSVNFLERLCREDNAEVAVALRHHVARKKVPYFDPENGCKVNPNAQNAIKMERFIFDVFPLAERFAIWEVLREEEFSPLKNAPGAAIDSPQTCRSSLLELHKSLLLNAGFESNLTSPVDLTVELSPLVTLAGESLESVLLWLNEQISWPLSNEVRHTLMIELDQESGQMKLTHQKEGDM